MTPPTDEARAGEPRTAAGRAFEVRFNDPMTRPRHLHDVRPAILAIEREAVAAPALDVETLEKALYGLVPESRRVAPHLLARLQLFLSEKAP